MTEKYKITDGRNPELKISIHCTFNFKDQRFSNETGLGREILGSKLSREIFIHLTWIYILVFSAVFWMSNAYTGSICIGSWERNPLKATREFRAITSGTAGPQCLLGSSGGDCHTHFLHCSLSCLWPALSDSILMRERVQILHLFCSCYASLCEFRYI